MNFKGIILLIAVVSATTTQAEVKDYYSECSSKYKSMNNSVVSECSSYADKYYKQSINSNYNKIYKALKNSNPEQADSFEKSQIGWLEYRNNYCELAGFYVGSPMYSFCPTQINQNRAFELEELADGF